MFNKVIKGLRAGFKLKNLFRISNLYMVALVYVAAVSTIIISNFEFSPNFWNKLKDGRLSNHRIAVYGVMGRIGEGLLYHKLLTVLEKQKIDYAAAKFPEEYMNFWISRHFYELSASIVNYFLKPNFNLAVTHYVQVVPYGYNVVYLNVPNDMLFTKNNKFKERYAYLTAYDAYLDLYSVLHGRNETLEEALKCHKCYDTKERKIFPGYLAYDHVEYKEANFDKILITGTLWGCNRNSLRMARALIQLKETDLLVAYGLNYAFDFLTDAYKGRIEVVKKETDLDPIAFLHQKYGIALLVHNLEHMVEGLPTTRISEAVANGAIVITDQNLFIKKFFGDNVLYFDAFGSVEEISEQIKSHYEWIKYNPESARIKARAAYDIFINNFTIEKQLQSLIDQLDSTN